MIFRRRRKRSEVKMLEECCQEDESGYLSDSDRETEETAEQ